jgi:pilus assembly protein CpaB
MNQNRMVIGLGVAVVVAFVLSLFVYRQFKAISVAPVAMPTNRIVVADEPLALGTRLDASKVKTVPWPSAEPMEGAITNVDDVLNRAVITDVAENEPILESKLAPVESGAGLPATIPEGMRAVSVAVNDVVGVAGFVIPGTMVDVLVTGTTMTSEGNVTRTILENVRVLAAGQKIEQDRDGKPQTVPVITLLVAPEDAAKLTMAATEGKIQLALRNTVDTKTTDPAPVLQTTLFGGPAPVVAHAPVHIAHVAPPPPYQVEVLSGSKREMKNFADQPAAASDAAPAAPAASANQ